MTKGIILAAGASFRLGHPKQLVMLPNGLTVLQNTVQCMLSNDLETYVILGSNSELVSNSLKEYNVKTLINEQWSKGMGSSIGYSISSIPSETTSVVISVCDQPYLDRHIIQSLVDTFHSTDSSIVASQYRNGKIGVPAIFDKSLFPKLIQLSGDMGAKKLIRESSSITTIDFPKGEVDIDEKKDINFYK